MDAIANTINNIPIPGAVSESIGYFICKVSGSSVTTDIDFCFMTTRENVRVLSKINQKVMVTVGYIYK